MAPRDLGIYPEVQTRPDVALDEDGRVLLRAADLIERDGWWNGGVDSGKRCALWAILDAYNEGGVFTTAAKARFERRLGLTNIPAWNDAQPSAETVTSALRSAAHAVPE